MAKKCVICGEWFNEQDMKAVFTGRTKYICFECYENASRKVDERMMKSTMKARKKHDR